jgi:uncharacterized membrane protein
MRRTVVLQFRPSAYSTGVVAPDPYGYGPMQPSYGIIWPWEVPSLIRRGALVAAVLGAVVIGGVAYGGYRAFKRTTRKIDFGTAALARSATYTVGTGIGAGSKLVHAYERGRP